MNRLGAFDPAERSHALDLFGFKIQLVLPTFSTVAIPSSSTAMRRRESSGS